MLLFRINYFFTNNKLSRDSDTANIDFKKLIKKYCHEHNHKLSKVFSPNPDISNEDDSQLNLRYKTLIKHFSDPDKQKSLILIPNSSHLANNLEIFISFKTSFIASSWSSVS